MVNKADLIDAPERRDIAASQFDIRTSGNSLKFEGYASTFNQAYDLYGGPPMGWHEVVAPTAFERSLQEKPDLHLLINHQGMPLARTKSGTLKLSTDNHGLLVRADLDRRDPEVQSLEIKMERGDMDEMSFGFRVKKQSWSEDETVRSLDEVSLHKGDVSIVNFGANPHTSASLRSILEMMAKLPTSIGEDELAEIRSMPDLIERADAFLRSLRSPVPAETQIPAIAVLTEEQVRALSQRTGTPLTAPPMRTLDEVADCDDLTEDGQLIERAALAPRNLDPNPEPIQMLSASQRAGRTKLTVAQLRAICNGELSL